MKFSDKIKNLRIAGGLTQSELAKELDMTTRTLQNYETGACYPRKRETVQRIADFFGVSTRELVGDEDVYIIQDTQNSADSIIGTLSGLFAGGSLSDEDKEKVMLAVNELYARSVEKNREKTHEKQNKI